TKYFANSTLRKIFHILLLFAYILCEISARRSRQVILKSLRMDLYRYQVREISEYAMFTLDPQGILQSWNAGVERLLGYSEQEWLGQPASIIFTPAEKAMEVCESEMHKAL